ncbi:MAG: HepT-like ribonuclease domain-containing protein [Thermoleophilia bacterium]
MAIDSYTAGLTREQLFGDRLRLDAVIKNLTVIGEAAGRVPTGVTEASPQIPWSRMRGMRNIVVHEHFGIDEKVLWGTVTDDLKPLAPLLTALLAEHSDAD